MFEFEESMMPTWPDDKAVYKYGFERGEEGESYEALIQRIHRNHLIITNSAASDVRIFSRPTHETWLSTGHKRGQRYTEKCRRENEAARLQAEQLKQAKEAGRKEAEEANKKHQEDEKHLQQENELLKKKLEALQKTPPVNPPSKQASGAAKTGPSDKGKKNLGISASYALKYEELVYGSELGRGGFGVVYKGLWCGVDVAIKQLIVTSPTDEAKKEFTKEIKVMKDLRFPNIVQFYGCCVGPQYCIVMEYMPKGSLFSVLHSTQSLEWPKRYEIATDIAVGLEFLHKQKILHRDLKSLNVLLDEHFKAKLTDFGLAKMKTETRTTTSHLTSKSANNKPSHADLSEQKKEVVGTLAWMAPELFEPEGMCSEQSDVYSLGITLCELVTRKIPFANAQDQALIPMWVAKGIRPKIDDAPKEAKKLASLVSFCWKDKPSERPSANKVVKFLKSKEEDFSKFGVKTAPKAASAHQSDYLSNTNSDAGSGYASEFSKLSLR